jgi:hypothetical protein
MYNTEIFLGRFEHTGLQQIWNPISEGANQAFKWMGFLKTVFYRI